MNISREIEICDLWNNSKNNAHDMQGSAEWKIVKLKGRSSISEPQS